MPAAAIVTLVLVGVLVAALAATLLIVLLTLRRTSSTLTAVIAGVRAIADGTEPLGEVLDDVARDITAVADVYGQLFAEHDRAASEVPAP